METVKLVANQTTLNTLGVTLIPKSTVSKECDALLASFKDMTHIDMALFFVFKDLPIEDYFKLYGEVQSFVKAYIQSYMLLEVNTYSGLSMFRSRNRIGDPSSYGVINEADYGLKNMDYVIKTDVTKSHVGLEVELLMGYQYFNQLRMVAPYWVYTYAAIHCNSNVEDPGGKSSHMWCNYESTELQLMLEKVEGQSYNSFLQNVTDPDRQCCVLARLVDAVGYMWINNITHGDLHANNVKVVTLADNVYTRVLTPLDQSVRDYIVGRDIPVILDYGMSSVLRKDGLFVIQIPSLQATHNPNYDLDKLMRWVRQSGRLYDRNLQFNSFGNYYHELRLALDALDISETVVVYNYPFVYNTIPKNVYTDTLPPDSSVYDAEIVRFQDEFLRNLMYKRVKLNSPQEVVNGINAEYLLSSEWREEAKKLVKTFRFEPFLENLKKISVELKAKKPMLKELNSVMDKGEIHSPAKKKETYQNLSLNLFTFSEDLFDLINSMYFSKVLLCKLPFVQYSQSDLIFDSIVAMWDKQELLNTCDILQMIAKIWQGLNYMSNKPNEFQSASQRGILMKTLSTLRKYIYLLFDLCNTSSSTPIIMSPTFSDYGPSMESGYLTN